MVKIILEKEGKIMDVDYHLLGPTKRKYLRPFKIIFKYDLIDYLERYKGEG